MSPHSIINMKFSTDRDHLFHEEYDSSITNIEQHVFVETMLQLLRFLVTLSPISTHI
jgi:hypothetical protein